MKKKIMILTAVVLAVMLAACGSSGKASSSAAAAMEAPAYNGAFYEEAKETEADYITSDDNAAMPAEGGSDLPYDGEVKLIYRADISAQTTDLEKAAEEIEQLVKNMGGYIEYSDKSSTSDWNDSYRYASYTVRIPAERYEAFLNEVGASGACKVTYVSKSTTDVGADYADTEARLETYRIKQERLQNLLKEAENMEDIITIENALSDVEYEIEYYSGTLKRYDSLIGFSTITISLNQVARETATVENGSLGERIASSFRNGISGFVTGCENFVVFLAGAFLPLLVIIAIIAAIVLIVRKLVHRTPKPKKKRRKKDDDEYDDEE